MAVRADVVTVGTTATDLIGADPNAGLRNVLVKVPAGGATVFLGGPDVTAAGSTQGFPVAAGESVPADLSFGDALFGIVAVGTQAVNVLRTGV